MLVSSSHRRTVGNRSVSMGTTNSPDPDAYYVAAYDDDKNDLAPVWTFPDLYHWEALAIFERLSRNWLRW